MGFGALKMNDVILWKPLLYLSSYNNFKIFFSGLGYAKYLQLLMKALNILGALNFEGVWHIFGIVLQH